MLSKKKVEQVKAETDGCFSFLGSLVTHFNNSDDNMDVILHNKDLPANTYTCIIQDIWLV